MGGGRHAYCGVEALRTQAIIVYLKRGRYESKTNTNAAVTSSRHALASISQNPLP